MRRAVGLTLGCREEPCDAPENVLVDRSWMLEGLSNVRAPPPPEPAGAQPPLQISVGKAFSQGTRGGGPLPEASVIPAARNYVNNRKCITIKLSMAMTIAIAIIMMIV